MNKVPKMQKARETIADVLNALPPPYPTTLEELRQQMPDVKIDRQENKYRLRCSKIEVIVEKEDYASIAQFYIDVNEIAHGY